MFLVASSGRCATAAICSGLDRFSDHRVRHEPEPRLLRESLRAHQGRWRWSRTSVERMREWRRLDGTPYGEAVRCAPLVLDIARVAPRSKVVVLVRRPEEYVRSAWGRGVMRKGDAEWDALRILPADAEGRPAVDRIALYYEAVNRILARTVERLGDRAMVAIVDDLDLLVDDIAAFAGVQLRDRAGLTAHFASRPNSGPVEEWAGDAPAASTEAMTRAEAAFTLLASHVRRRGA